MAGANTYVDGYNPDMTPNRSKCVTVELSDVCGRRGWLLRGNSVFLAEIRVVYLAR